MKHRILARLATPLLRFLVGALMIYLGPWRRVNNRAFPKRGGVLVIANHQSDLDPVLTQLACPRPIHFMASVEIFEMGWVGHVMRWYSAFPVRRGEVDRSAIRHAIALLKAGEVVCMYPEGRISPDGKLLPIMPGMALIAKAGNAPVIALGIEGARFVRKYETKGVFRYGKTIWLRWSDPRPAPHEDAQALLAWASETLADLVPSAR